MTNWLHEFYGLDNINDATITAKFMSHINDYLEEDRFDLCDELLDVVDIERLHPVLMVALIRSTFSFQHELNNWTYYRDKISALLDELGYDAMSVLRGLY